MNSSLSTAVTHAVAYLTHPLAMQYPATSILKLQLILEANLISSYAPSWVPTEPLRGSGRRCMTLSPTCLPPRAIYAACIASGVQWLDWIACLGGREFDLLVNPGCISLRFNSGGSSNTITVWSDKRAKLESRSQSLAQQLCEENDEELFALIADELTASSKWSTPTYPERPSSALSDFSDDSSRSSGGCSFSSVESLSSVSSPVSRRQRARNARVHVDLTKTNVTAYDAGKVGVLTGGVMLGGGPTKAAASAPNALYNAPRGGSWRSSRY